MAKRRKSSGGLVAALGTTGAKAVQFHAKEDTKFSTGGSLPPGIENGIAKLSECKFDTYKKGDNEGEYYFIAAGIVVEPTVAGSVPIRGLRTQIMEPLCDTPTRSRPTQKDHVGWVLNELRKLGVDTTDMDVTSLESVCQALKESQPYFRFRTWQGKPTTDYPDPMVNEVWNGACPDYTEGEVEDAVDESDEEESEEEDAEDENEETDDASEEHILSKLGELADAEDDDATLQLTEKAEENGLDVNDYDAWSDLATALENIDEPEDNVVAPEKEEVYGYRPPRHRKDVECEVTAVFASKETCNLKNLDDGKAYKGVPWSKLVSDEE